MSQQYGNVICTNHHMSYTLAATVVTHKFLHKLVFLDEVGKSKFPLSRLNMSTIKHGIFHDFNI